MSALDLCERETVEIATFAGPRKVPAWRYGTLACHLGIATEHGKWTVTHLPTGLGFLSLGVFDNVENATAAMIEIARLRNEWFLEKEDLPRLGAAAREIYARHGAKPIKARFTRKSAELSTKQLAERLNGYDREVAP